MNRQPKPLAALMAALVVLHSMPLVGIAQTETTQSAPAVAPQEPVFKPEQIEQLVAPIALYPDALVAQVLMATTYPLEVVEAARWQQQNSSLKDTALEDALQQQTWDPSVKSLVAFPSVLTMLNEKLDWTQKLGDAFLAQQSDVMDAVQRLRAKAEAAGNLTSNEQQKVIIEQAPVTVQQNVTVQGQAAAPPPTVIRIEPAQPQVVYVPTYNPTVVYGAWPYPAYPPYYYYPPGYVAATSVISFGIGMAVGAALWGGCSWGGYGHSNVNINVNNYNSYNKTNISNNNWQHNVDHRKGVQYRDQATQQKYNRGDPKGAQSREAFRGRADQGRQDMARGAGNNPNTRQAAGANGSTRQAAAGANGGARPATTAANGAKRPATADRAPVKAQAQRPSAPARATSKGGDQAFQGMGNGGKQARADANRGQASRQSAATAQRGGGASKGGARPSGGGAPKGGSRPSGGGGRGR